jgi:HlyD family secretion protein
MIGAVVIVVVAGGLTWWWAGTRRAHSEHSFTGYVVSDNVYMSSPVSGTLTSVSVRRGARVAAGDSLFRVDPTVRAAEADRARAEIAGSSAQLEQQQAMRVRAQADLAAAGAEAQRNEVEMARLAAAQAEKPGSVAQLQVDQARAAYRGARDKRDAARSEVQAATGAITAAQAQVQQARAGLTSAQHQLSDLAPVAPGAGRIDDVMFKPGESVAANVPVVSIVPDGEVKVRFYVPETQVSAYKPGRKVVIGCDGCAAGMTAIVDFVASRPEYTPPVIYSLDARAKLVFLIEAVPSDPLALVPGQPMDVADTAADLPQR